MNSVMLLLFNKRWAGACAGALVVILSALGASAATPKRVLILNPFGRDVEPFSSVVSSFRTTLSHELGEPVDRCWGPWRVEALPGLQLFPAWTLVVAALAGTETRKSPPGSGPQSAAEKQD